MIEWEWTIAIAAVAYFAGTLDEARAAAGLTRGRAMLLLFTGSR